MNKKAKKYVELLLIYPVAATFLGCGILAMNSAMKNLGTVWDYVWHMPHGAKTTFADTWMQMEQGAFVLGLLLALVGIMCFVLAIWQTVRVVRGTAK